MKIFDRNLITINIKKSELPKFFLKAGLLFFSEKIFPCEAARTVEANKNRTKVLKNTIRNLIAPAKPWI